MSGAENEAEVLERISDVIDDAPFQAWLPARLTGIDPDGSVRLRAEWVPSWGNGGDGGHTHGGVIAALLDLAAECAVMAAFGAAAPTVDLNVRFLAPTREEPLTATGSLVRKGRTLTVAEARVLREDGVLVAMASGAFATFAIAR